MTSPPKDPKPAAPPPRGRTPSRVAPDLSKAERRAAGKLAAARRRAAQRRARQIRVAGVFVAVLAVLALVAWWAGLFGGDSGTPAATPTTAAPAATPTGFTLPPGADPALGSKPATGPGQGELTELKVTTLIPGTGEVTRNGQRLTVNYVGVLYKTGEEFDASWNSGEPLTFTLGEPGIIEGWGQGLVNVKVGSRVQLDIPARLAYGDPPQAGKPPGALRFVVDVLAAS